MTSSFHSVAGTRAANDTMYHLGKTAGDGYPRLWDDNATIMRFAAAPLVQPAEKLATRLTPTRYLGWAATVVSVLLWVSVVVKGWAVLVLVIAAVGTWTGSSGSLESALREEFADQSASWVTFLVVLALAVLAAVLSGTCRRLFRTRSAQTRQQLFQIGCTGIGDAVEARRDMDRHIGRRGPSGQLCAAPFAYPAGIDPRAAEFLVAAWIRYLGDPDAVTTQATRDGGVDVESPRHIAQVKHWAGTVPVGPIRELVGVAAMDGRRPLFFTSGRFTRDAVAFADGSGMPLFIFNPYAGTLTGGNALGTSLVDRGL